MAENPGAHEAEATPPDAGRAHAGASPAAEPATPGPPASPPQATPPVPTQTPKPGNQHPLVADHFRIIRWIAAFLILAGCVTALMGAKFHTCKVETSKKGDEVTSTRTCSPPSVSDGSVVAVAFLLVLLIAPDMSEVGVFGISLKRRLEAAESKAAESKATADVLETRLQVQNSRIENLSQNLANASATAQAVNTTFVVSSNDMETALRDLLDKAQAFARGDEEIPVAAAFIADASSESADPELSVKLLYNYETIMASLGITDNFPVGMEAVRPIAVTYNEARRFENVFSLELSVVRAARNNVAHAKHISDEDLHRAVTISDELIRILKNSPSRQED